MNEIDVVRDISRKFEQAGIAYMLTGSMAMQFAPDTSRARLVQLGLHSALRAATLDA
jgi:hypothetical protein